MRSTVRCGLAVLMIMLAGWGCAGTRDAADMIPTTINDVDSAQGYSKTIAIALTHTTPTDFGRRIGGLFYRTLIDGLRDEDPHLQLMVREDGRWPDSMDEIAQVDPQPADALPLAERARMAGLNGWAWARVENLQPVARRTGLLWFRKERYFIFAELSFSVFDSFTGAKIVDKVVEISTSVDKAEYDAMKTGKAVAIDDFDESIADIAADMGEHAAKVLHDLPWQTAVIGIQGDRVFLSSGASAGLRGGDRLAVFSGRRTIEGQNGERFVVPGPEVGLIQIVQVAAGVSEAKLVSHSGDTPMVAGDIAVAVK